MSNLPNVIIVGAQKCGTTTLYFSLKHHSKVQAPMDPEEQKTIKEIDFFFDENKWNKGVDWYKDHFKLERQIYLDPSPNYLVNPTSLKKLSEVCPKAKILICLRDPVERAYSQYNHYRRDLPKSKDWDWYSSLNFEENIRVELSKGCDYKSDFFHFIGRGIYINQIEHLLQFFDLSQIYVTILERWKLNYEEELKKIQNFLNIEYEPLPLIPCHRLRYEFEPMSLELIALLKEFYLPYNQRLFKFLDFDIPEWLD